MLDILTKPAPWCIAPGYFESLRGIRSYQSKAPTPAAGEATEAFAARSLSWGDYVEAEADEENGMEIDPVSGIAVQPITGTIMKGASPEMEVYCGFFDLNRITAACSRAATDDSIRALVFLIDSPGGYSGGITECLQSMANLRATRPDLPVLSYIPDYCASLAYWLACSTQQIHASRDAQVGGIGSYVITQDSSNYYKALGLDIQLIASGEYKGMGSAGVSWKPEWYAEIAAKVERSGARFRQTVSAFRPAVSPAQMNGLCFEAPEVAGPGELVDSASFPDADAFLAAVAAALPERV